MDTVKVSSKGQIVIPKAIRESHHIKAGTELVISVAGDELRLTPVPALEKTSIKEAAGILYRRGRKYLDTEKARQAIGRMIAAQDKTTRSR
ncbi:MAG: AbrB/MazE/SpoVT family DNA-binding domain-containing protein [Acidiferrobacteraceae bacterium]